MVNIFTVRYLKLFKRQRGIFINELECLAVVVALKSWGPDLRGMNVHMYCDNTTTVQAVNSGRAKNLFLQKCMREIAYIQAQFSFQIRMIHQSGVDNRVSDYLSRWSLDSSFKDKFFEEISRDYDVTKIKQVLISEAHFVFTHDW